MVKARKEAERGVEAQATMRANAGRGDSAEST